MVNKKDLIWLLFSVFGFWQESFALKPTATQIEQICRNLKYPGHQLNPLVGFMIFGLCCKISAETMITISAAEPPKKEEKESKKYLRKRYIIIFLNFLEAGSFWNSLDPKIKDPLESNLHILIYSISQILATQILDGLIDPTQSENQLTPKQIFFNFLTENFNRPFSNDELDTFIEHKIDLLVQIIARFTRETEINTRLITFYRTIIETQQESSISGRLAESALEKMGSVNSATEPEEIDTQTPQKNKTRGRWNLLNKIKSSLENLFNKKQIPIDFKT